MMNDNNIANNQLPTEIKIIKGIRGDEFTDFIKSILRYSTLKPEFFDKLLGPDYYHLYEQAFTHPTADKVYNYEWLEFLGDSTLNKSIAWYLYRRFPKLACPEGVKILTRVKINLISKKNFAAFAKKLNFWNYISADENIRASKMEKTLEDVFESFFGATELIIDQLIRPGAGYFICYSMVSNLLNTHPISLRYEDLYDAKTRLKEICDHFGGINGNRRMGAIVYHTEKVDGFHRVTISLAGKSLSYGTARLKADASQIAAASAIDELKTMGFTKPIHEDYEMLCS